MDAGQRNDVSSLNEFPQKSGFTATSVEVKSNGPAHNKTTHRSQYPEEDEQSKEEARQNAAKNAVSCLKEDKPENTATDDSTSPTSMNVLESVSSDSSVVFASSPSKRPSVNSPKVVNTDRNPSTKSRFLEDFESIVKVGSGGYGSVYRAKRRLEDKNYAVKLVKFSDKALKEISALARFNHPNIVRYYTSWVEETKYRDNLSQSSSSTNSGIGSECKYLYIQMELCEGDTLCKWIEERNSEQNQDWRKEAAIIMRQVLEAVKYIHSKNRFHRDLKPANIMFGGEGMWMVKVGDFGHVTEEEEDSDGDRMKRTVETGTYSYMAPEQREQSLYDRKVDIYALGLIYFELVWFFTGHEKSKIWSQIRERNFPEDFSERFSFEHKLIDEMLHEDPGERPEASKLLSELVESSAVLT